MLWLICQAQHCQATEHTSLAGVCHSSCVCMHTPVSCTFSFHSFVLCIEILTCMNSLTGILKHEVMQLFLNFKPSPRSTEIKKTDRCTNSGLSFFKLVEIIFWTFFSLSWEQDFYIQYLLQALCLFPESTLYTTKRLLAIYQ